MLDFGRAGRVVEVVVAKPAASGVPHQVDRRGTRLEENRVDQGVEILDVIGASVEGVPIERIEPARTIASLLKAGRVFRPRVARGEEPMGRDDR